MVCGGLVAGLEEFDRGSLVRDLLAAAATFDSLLGSADLTGLRRRSNGTRWTNEQLLFHMLFGFMIVRALLVLVRVFGRLPPWVSVRFATALNAVTTPFDWVNYWGSRLGVRIYGKRRMGPKMSRVTASLGRRLEREDPADLARSMSYPTRWDPFFRSTMSLADVYRFPVQHFAFHRRQLTL
jgi:hypothetical protein